MNVSILGDNDRGLTTPLPVAVEGTKLPYVCRLSPELEQTWKKFCQCYPYKCWDFHVLSSRPGFPPHLVWDEMRPRGFVEGWFVSSCGLFSFFGQPSPPRGVVFFCCIRDNRNYNIVRVRSDTFIDVSHFMCVFLKLENIWNEFNFDNICMYHT